jgi:hypothetical protein
MRILLVDVDSKLPNLALMKLSAWHKAQGDQVGFHVSDPEKVYVSCIFKQNAANIRGIQTFYPDAEVEMGGPGYDLHKDLPPEIEFVMPDYSIYPEMDFSLGFSTRGCIRNCYFCIVPEKEGQLHRWQHPRDFHNDAFSKIMLLDNNWLADEEWFFETSAWIRDQGLYLREGGMDIRLMTNEIARRLKELKWYSKLKFAFDNDRDQQAVLEGIRILKDAKVDIRGSVWFYVYLNDNSDKAFESALARCRFLKENGTGAFVMFNIENKPSRRTNDLRRWANKPWVFWKVDFDQYGVKT